MVENGNQAHFAKVQGYREVIFQTSSMIAVMAGGLLADISYDLAIKAAISIFLLAIMIAFFFKEPLMKEKQKKTTIKSLVKTSVETLKAQPMLGWMMLYGALFLSSSATFFFYLSTYLVDLGYSLSAVALWYTVNTIGSIFAGLMVNKLIERFDIKLILLSSILLTVSLFFMPILPWGMIAFFVNGAMESILYVTMTHHINRQISSEIRATLLSVNSMAYSVIMAVMFPLFGFIGDQLGLFNAFMLSSGMMGLFVLCFMLWQRTSALTGPRFFGIMGKK